jgi:hypothetical protein
MNTTLDRLIQVFSRNGYVPQSRISQLQFLTLLDQLLVWVYSDVGFIVR